MPSGGTRFSACFSVSRFSRVGNCPSTHNVGYFVMNSVKGRLLFLLTFVVGTSGFAHPADNSQARFKVEPRRVEFRLTFNLYTLQQFHRLDIDGDGTITKKELDSAEKPLREYLLKHILITINGDDTDLGEARPMERMWPEVSIGPDVLAADYGQRFVDFVFVREWKATIESVWIGYDIFKETGDLHAIQAVFEQDGMPTEVLFSKNEPEYEWATDFADAPSSNEGDKQSSQQSASAKKGGGVHPIAITLGVVALICTLLLLGKVRRISRGGFRVPYRE